MTLRTVRLRVVEETDARFVLDLRLDPLLNQHLSPVEDDLGKQVEWIRQYKNRERDGREFYFIIETLESERLGTVRMYDFRTDSFGWGSWILRRGAPVTATIESALGVYDFAFDQLGFPKAHFDVRRANTKVIRFHERFGAKRVSEDELNLYFELTRDDFQTTRSEYRRYCGLSE